MRELRGMFAQGLGFLRIHPLQRGESLERRVVILERLKPDHTSTVASREACMIIEWEVGRAAWEEMLVLP